MFSFWLPVLFAVLIWWFSTGLVLLLDNLPRTTFRWSLVISSAVGLGALVGLAHTAGQTTVAGAYCAFTCALLVWGWHELSFLTGWITGPRKTASAAGLSGWPRFSQAVMAILWHEAAIVTAGCIIIGLTWGEPNQTGTWTFLVLWIMRTSAKLNLFFGVRNLSEEFLPAHLAYLQSFFRRRPMNGLFPFAVTTATGVTWLMVNAALDPAATPAQVTGLLLVSTLLGLAILEHLLLVLPFSANALWRWAMRKPPRPAPAVATSTCPTAPVSDKQPLQHA
jgi:putative photosynthetic complex assembly protein 2